jgi:flagellar motor switch protein FliN
MSTSDKQSSTPTVSNVDLENLSNSPSRPGAPAWTDQRLDLIRDVPVEVEAKLGVAQLSVARLFALRDGDALTLDTRVDEPVDILLEGKVIARGEIVVVGEHFGVRLREIIAPDRL